MHKTTGCIMKAFMWVVGIASLGFGIYFLMQDTSNWPQVEAVVTSSDAVSSDDLNNVTYQTWYEYQVDGVTYQSYINDYTQYTRGDKLKVYYDPKSPATTIQSHGEYATTGCIGVVFGLVCIGSMAWGAIKSRRQAETPAETNTAG